MPVTSDVCALLHAPSPTGKRTGAPDSLHAAGLLLVAAIVRQLEARFGRVLAHDDMVSLGNLGLVEAMCRFDPSRGVEFKAYASQRIRGEIIDGMRTEGFMPRRAWDRVSRELGDELFDCQVGPAELDLIDCAPSPEDLALQSQEAQEVREAMQLLPREHAELVQRCYGEDQSLQQISEDLGFAPGWGSRTLPLVRESLRQRLEGHHQIQAKRTPPEQNATPVREEPKATEAVRTPRYPARIRALHQALSHPLTQRPSRRGTCPTAAQRRGNRGHGPCNHGARRWFGFIEGHVDFMRSATPSGRLDLCNAAALAANARNERRRFVMNSTSIIDSSVNEETLSCEPYTHWTPAVRVVGGSH